MEKRRREDRADKELVPVTNLTGNFESKQTRGKVAARGGCEGRGRREVKPPGRRFIVKLDLLLRHNARARARARPPSVLRLSAFIDGALRPRRRAGCLRVIGKLKLRGIR